MNTERKKSVVLITGLSNGRIVYDYFASNKKVDVMMIITYPDDCTKPRHKPFPIEAKVVRTYRANDYIDEIRSISPDFIFVAGWSELLQDDLLDSSTLGTIGFHPSKLPLDRGRSVLAWQLEEGYKETALTMFYYNAVPDGGDIIGQELIPIEDNDYLNDILDKIDVATYNLLRAYFRLLRMGLAPRLQQDINEGNFRRLRTDRDSIIDWHQNATKIYNKVRAISKPYPGAIFTLNNSPCRAYGAKVMNEFPVGTKQEPGTLIARFYDDSLLFKCRDTYLHITEWEQDVSLLE
jgi:methionyl-tRNA formyltransferase